MNEFCYANSSKAENSWKKLKNLSYLGQCLFPIKENNSWDLEIKIPTVSMY